MRPQQDFQVLLFDFGHTHVDKDEVYEHVTSHSLHVRVVLHEEHVEVHVDFFESAPDAIWSIGEPKSDPLYRVRVHPTMLHDVSCVTVHGHFSLLPCILESHANSDFTCNARMLISNFNVTLERTLGQKVLKRNASTSNIISCPRGSHLNRLVDKVNLQYRSVHIVDKFSSLGNLELLTVSKGRILTIHHSGFVCEGVEVVSEEWSHQALSVDVLLSRDA